MYTKFWVQCASQVIIVAWLAVSFVSATVNSVTLFVCTVTEYNKENRFDMQRDRYG